MLSAQPEVLELAGGAVLVSREQSAIGQHVGNTDNAGIVPVAGDYTDPTIRCLQDMVGHLGELTFSDPLAVPDPDARCDRCGFSAVAEFWVIRGEIALCGHHTRQHLRALAEMGASPLTADASRLWFLDLPAEAGE